MKQLFVTLFLTLGFFAVNAQTADEVINQYFENTGGVEAWKALEQMTTKGNASAQGMEIPMVMEQKKGKMKMSMEVQGKKITQMCFNGEEGWSHNFMTMEAEKWDDKQNALMVDNVDFPSPFMDYKEKGYTVSLEGEEEIEGTPCFKIKLTKKPMMVEGKEVENVSYHFFDKDSYALIQSESLMTDGPMKGAIQMTSISDYEEVGGLYFPFTIAQKIGEQQIFSMTITEIDVKTPIADEVFDFPKK